MGDVVIGFVMFFVLGTIPVLMVVVLVVVPMASALGITNTDALTEIVFASGPVLVLSLVLSWCGFMGVVYWSSHYKGDGNWRALLKWHFQPRRDIPIAIAFTLVAFAAEIAIGIVLEALGVDSSDLGNTDVLNWTDGFWLILLALGIAIGSPIVEELFFRGLFLSVAVRNWGRIIGVIVVSVCFGLMHIQDSLAASLYTMTLTALLGMVLAIMVLRTGRIGTSISTHMLFNTSAVALALLATH